jgi:nitrite reductase (NADH) small subunit
MFSARIPLSNSRSFHDHADPGELEVTDTERPDANVYAGTRSEFADDTRKIVDVGGREVGVLLHEGRFYAYENRCAHQGGPVCEGRILGRVEAVLGDDKTLLGETFSTTTTHLVCPWHGFEYDLETGECAADRRLRLRRYDVLVKGDDVYVIA